MRSIVVIAIVLSVAMLADGRKSYKIDPTEWADYQSAVSTYGLKDTTPAKKGQVPNNQLTYPAPRFNVEYTFTGKCAEASNTSYSYAETKATLNSFGCKLNKWMNTSCSAITTFTCGALTDATKFVQSSGTLHTYGKAISHWWVVKTDKALARHKREVDDSLNAAIQAKKAEIQAKRTAFMAAKNESSEAKRQSSLPPYVWPGEPNLQNAQDCHDTNDAMGYDAPAEDRPRWHVQAISQNNGQVPSVAPFKKNSAYAGSTQGHIYIADAGIDGKHPEFIDSNGLSRVQDVSIYPWIDPEAELWMGPGHDEAGHGTTVAAFAAGKTLGVFPTAKIVNLKFYIDNLYDCYFNPVAAADIPVVNAVPANYPFLSECLTYGGSYGYQSFVLAAQYALTDAAALRALGQPSVFLTSAAPRWTVLYDGPITDCSDVGCMDTTTTIMQSMVSSGLLIVIAAGNEGATMDNEYDFMNIFGCYQPYIWVIPEVVVVGGLDRSYGQSIYRKIGYDDTDWNTDWEPELNTGASNWGNRVNFYAPATAFNQYAMTHRVRHREIDLDPTNGPGWADPVYVPPYWKTNLASGNSFAAPQVAAGLLMYQTTLPTATIMSNPIPTTLAAAKEWAAPHYQTQFWDDYLDPVNEFDPNRPASHLGEDWGDWVADPRVIWSFHLIPSAEQYCPV